MSNIPAGFIPDVWNQTLGAFQRLVQQLASVQNVLAECAELTPENSDIEFIREQIRAEVDTLQFMTNDAEKRWKSIGLDVASAVGRFNMNRPADNVAWCSAILNAAWQLYNGLRRELAGENAELCVQRLPLHVGRIPNDIDTWRNRITAELRAGAICENSTKTAPLPINRSKPLRFKTWYDRFKAARYSDNESERAFRDWLKGQIANGKAVRSSEKGPISFDLEFLKLYGVKPT
ncbi:MAG: hypothetical protein WKF77_06255 [Planctomycetaceae bacterium]